MKASLDTNVIIHLYRAGMEQILFDCFDDGLYIYEQIYNIELNNHGKAILDELNKDIKCGKCHIITDSFLKKKGVYTLFKAYEKDNQILYNSGDKGEVLAISLAQTLGLMALVTDDIKQGGPYMSLLQLRYNEVMPFAFTDILMINYLNSILSAEEALSAFDQVNKSANLNWSFKSHFGKFIRRFWTDPYQMEEKEWMKSFCERNKIPWHSKIRTLNHQLKQTGKK